MNKSLYNPGDKIGKYKLISRCGEGGFGEVWSAENDKGEKLALKINRQKYADKELKGIFSVPKGAHPNLLEIIDIGLDDGTFYYAMPLADNVGSADKYEADTLAYRIEHKTIPPKEVYELAEKMAAALGHLHNNGLIHRDVKPDNIIYVKGEPVLTDFGLVTESNYEVSRGGTFGFLPAYVNNREHTPCQASDFYALGATLQCALTGKKDPDLAKLRLEMTYPAPGGDLVRLFCTLEDQSKKFSESEDFIDSAEKFLACLYGKKLPVKAASDSITINQTENSSGNYNGLRNIAILMLIFALLYHGSAIKMQLQEGFPGLNIGQIFYMYFVSFCTFLCPALVLLYCRKVLKSSPAVSPLTKKEMLKYALLMGIFGGHRFHAGMKFTGSLMLLSFGGLGIWWLTDILLLSFDCFSDSRKRLIRSKK